VQDPAVGEVLFRLAIGPAVAVFLLLAMADHLLVSAPRVHRWYEATLQRRANYARWIEYSVSASIMIVLNSGTGVRRGARHRAGLAADPAGPRRRHGGGHR
jgi:hypothetical protein